DPLRIAAAQPTHRDDLTHREHAIDPTEDAVFVRQKAQRFRGDVRIRGDPLCSLQPHESAQFSAPASTAPSLDAAHRDGPRERLSRGGLETEGARRPTAGTRPFETVPLNGARPRRA